MYRANRFVEMMDYIQKTDVIKSLVERFLKNITFNEFDIAADDPFQ